MFLLLYIVYFSCCKGTTYFPNTIFDFKDMLVYLVERSPSQ